MIERFLSSKPSASRSIRVVALGIAFLILSANVRAESAQVRPPPKDMLGKIVAASGDAYVAYDEDSRTWEIGNAGMRRRMQYTPATGFRVSGLTNMRTGTEWVAPRNDSNTGLYFALDGEEIRGSDVGFVLRGFDTQTHADGSIEVRISLGRGTLIAHLHFVLFPATSVMEQWAAIENTGNTVLRNLTALDSISVELRPSEEALILYWVQGLSPQIRDPLKTQALPVLRLTSSRLTEGASQSLGATARSTEDSMGWFALHDPELREGIFGGIEWSGAWQLRASRERGQTILRAGMTNLRHDLAPGEVFNAPRRFLGFYAGDLDDAANESRIFARTYLMRPMPRDFPWTQYNTWYASNIDLNEDQLKRDVDAAAALGLELFYVDAGWYEGSPQQGDFGWGLGTWRENREKFPNGLAAFSDYVHGKGMKFGLWVEPERVDLRYVGKDIPREWLSPEAIETFEEESDIAPTALICLNHREARGWMKAWLTRVVEDYRVDWLKWDYNVIASCNPPGQPGDGDYFHFQGLYEVLDYLRERFPNLVIENCASGGNRMDYALMRRTDLAWLSDQTDPSFRVRYHLAGASYAFPPEYLNTWLIDSNVEPLADTIDPQKLRAWMRSRMMGAFGISARIAEWSEELRTNAAAEIAQYKSMRRMIANGAVYRLLPQGDLQLPDLDAPASPDAAEFFSAVDNEGVVFLFAGAVPWTQRRVQLRGLEPDTLYTVTTIDRSMSMRRTGKELMTQGVRFRYDASRPSVLLFLKPAPLETIPEPTLP